MTPKTTPRREPSPPIQTIERANPAMARPLVAADFDVGPGT